MLLTLKEIIKTEVKHRSFKDGRRKMNYVLASYIGEDGYEYRKSFESYGNPIVPQSGNHVSLNILANQ